jgi:hypothetical protein
VANNDYALRSVNGRARSARKQRYLEFKAAVLGFSDAPTAASLVRYLNASRALEGLDQLPQQPAELVNRHHRFALPSR